MKTKYLQSAIVSIVLLGCTAHNVERTNLEPGSLKQFSSAKITGLKVLSPYLKAHMKNGALYVFDSWDFEKGTSEITGHATLFSALRDTLGKGQYLIGLDSVAILETNVIENSGSAGAITVFMGITAAITVNCIISPKSCFGSCPTFYVDDGQALRLQAEGFSSSISPSLEATDIDAVYHGAARNGEVDVVMRNEALETHVVRHVDLLTVPRRRGHRVFATVDQEFWESPAQLPPVSAKSPEGDCLTQLLIADGSERFSLADENYLGAKERIELEFRIDPAKKYGLVVGCRQTLLPTYLLYQTLAYMGNDVGKWLARIERQRIAKGDRMSDLIGGIDVDILTRDGSALSAGAINEHGPLAMDMHMIPLPALADSSVRIQLHMTKGTWRIDYVGLAELSRPAHPNRVHPSIVVKDGKEDVYTRALLLDSARVLISLPGDEYTLKYALPDASKEYELFIESRGYYLEWIRKEWIEEENPLLLTQMFLDPAGALTRLAPEFKRVEPTMEDCFWRSRYAKP